MQQKTKPPVDENQEMMDDLTGDKPQGEAVKARLEIAESAQESYRVEAVLLDTLAGRAMQGLVTQEYARKKGYDGLAIEAYKYAQAMIRVRGALNQR